MKNFKKILLFSVILPFMFSVVRAENMEDKTAENTTASDKVVQTVSNISSVVKSLFQTSATPTLDMIATNTSAEIIIPTAIDTDKVASTTKEIADNIKKQVKENKGNQSLKIKKLKKITRNSCDIFLSTLDKSEVLDDKINNSLVKIDDLQKKVNSEFTKRESILANLKNVLKSEVSDKDKDAADIIQKNLEDAKEFYVDLDDKNKNILDFLQNNLCDKVKNTDASEKETVVDLLISKEKIYKKTLASILKDVVVNLQNEIVKTDK